MIYFFQMMMPLPIYVATFSQQLHFRRIYFVTASTSSVQLDIKSNQFDIKITFSKQLFLQSCYFFGTATFSDLSVLLSSFFFRTATFLERNFYRASNYQIIDSYLGQLLFSGNELVQNKDIYIRATFLKQVLLYSINFFKKS